MAGFAKFAVIGQAGAQEVVNIFHYRSTVYNPLAGVPFDAMQDAVDIFTTNLLTTWLACHNGAYVLQRVEGTGYDDAMHEIPGSSAVHTVQQIGNDPSAGEFDTFGHTANITWILGAQHQITGLGSSKRNRGTTSIGPVSSGRLSDDGHFTGDFISAKVDAAANMLRTTLLDIMEWSTIIPIRIHKAYALGVQTGLTYSDILGYKLPTVSGFRRSRLPEF